MNDKTTVSFGGEMMKTNNITKISKTGDMAKFVFTTIADNYDQEDITNMIHAFAQVLHTKGIQVVNAEFDPIVNQ